MILDSNSSHKDSGDKLRRPNLRSPIIISNCDEKSSFDNEAEQNLHNNKGQSQLVLT